VGYILNQRPRHAIQMVKSTCIFG